HETGGLAEISRGLRSAGARRYPRRGNRWKTHPGGVPEIPDCDYAALDWRLVLAPLRGADRSRAAHRGCRSAQPPANVWQPSRLTRSDLLQVGGPTVERAHRAEGFADGGESEFVRHRDLETE